MKTVDYDKWWKWQCWRRRMNATTKSFSLEWMNQYYTDKFKQQ